MEKFLCFNRSRPILSRWFLSSLLVITVSGCVTSSESSETATETSSADVVATSPSSQQGTGVSETAPTSSEPALSVDETSESFSKPSPSSDCLRYGSNQNFNDQRIVAFQKLLQLQILRIKAFPMTEESTQELAQLEAIRRRTIYPLLTSSLKVQKVTEILAMESQDFVAFLDQRRKVDKQAQSLFREMTQNFIPHLKSQDRWNCIEKKTEFEEEVKPKGP